MAGAWLTTDEIIALVDEQILLLGKDAFGSNRGYAQLYSGPNREILSLIINPSDRNHGRAKLQAAPDSAVILDDTPIGLFLESFGGKGIYDYFANNPYVPRGKEAEAADKIMRHVSRKFVASLWGNVATAVCGAAKDRVFYTDEIPTFAETIPELITKLLKSDDIETINGIPIANIRKLYNPNDYDAAFRLICLGELRMAWRRARHSRKAENIQDYLERREFYLVERSLTWKSTPKAERIIYRMAPQDRLVLKQNYMNKFVTAGLNTVVTAIAGPHIPSLPVQTARKRASGAHPN